MRYKISRTRTETNCLKDRQVYLFDDWGIVVIYKQMHELLSQPWNRKRASLRQGQPSFL